MPYITVAHITAWEYLVLWAGKTEPLTFTVKSDVGNPGSSQSKH